jgi:hypothetical protein
VKSKLTVLFVLFLLAIFGSRAAFFISKKLHIDFTDIYMDFDDEIL